METSSLDFVYLESDPRTKQPSACIYLKQRSAEDFADVKANQLVSSHCLSFIELDAEIRARAKKKFYRAHAAGAGA